MKRQIIVPIDDSSHSHRALKFACVLAKELDAEIVLLNVQPNYDLLPNVHRFISKEDIQLYIQEAANGILNKAIPILTNQDIHYEKLIRSGIPKEEITNLAKERHAHSIIMGTRGLGAVKSAFIGSVSLGVIQQAPCPVTLVP